MTQLRYNSIFSGQAIDQAVSNMQNAVTLVDIANDFNGGTTKVASAELAKTLNTNITTGLSPSNIAAIILSIPNSNIYTTAEKNKLASLSTALTGSYYDVLARTATAPSPVGYVGTELSFVVHDGTNRNLAQLSRWDISSATWKMARLYNIDEFVPVIVPTASVFPLYSFNKTRFSLIKVLISCVDSAGLNRQIQEVLVSFVGTDTYISVYGEVGNSSTLFNLTTSISGNIITLSATTSTTNSVISYKMTDMF